MLLDRRCNLDLSGYNVGPRASMRCGLLIFPLLAGLAASGQDTISVEASEPMAVCSQSHPEPCATPPHVVSSPEPAYSEKARQTRREGAVILTITVGSDGLPHNIRVAKPLGDGLDEQAVAAVQQWKFDPARYEGKPVPVQINIEVRFRLNGNSLPVESNTDQIRNLFANAQEAYARHDFQSAADLSRRVTVLSPENRVAWNLLGISLLELRELDAAATALEMQIKVDPASNLAYNNLGRVYWMQRKYDEALREFQRQLEINPQDHYAHANLGMMYRDQHNCQAAEPELQKALAATPDNSSAMMALGECDLEFGDKPKGLSEIQQAASASPSSGRWNSAAYTLAKHNLELDQAQKWAETAITMEYAQLKDASLDHLTPAQFRLADSMARYWDTMGWVYFRRGEFDRSVEYLNAAWNLRPDPVMGDHLGEAYEKLGRHDDALRTYRMAVAAVDYLRGGFTADDIDCISDAKARVKALDSNPAPDRIDLSKALTLSLQSSNGKVGSAEFEMMVTGDTISAARRISGDASFDSFVASLKSVHVNGKLPSDANIQIPRRGTINCGPSACELLFMPSREAAELASREAGASIVTKQALVVDSHEFNSAALGMKMSLSDGWRVLRAEPGSYSHPQGATVGKPGTLAFLQLTREHLESTPTLYRKMLDSGFAQRTGFKRTAEKDVILDGIPGTRWEVEWEDKGITYRGVVEFFSVGDDHYRIAAMAPSEVYGRYVQDFEDMTHSVRFPMLHADPKLLESSR
jgi:TonB family protein